MANGDEYFVLEREFLAAGIDVTRPGFCDSEAFFRAEAEDPNLTLKYARYIRGRSYQQQYADRVRTRVPHVVEFLAGELVRDGRQGACIDACGVALKFLEREDVWGYCSVGSMVIDFVNPPGRHVVLHHFMHPNNPARAGHAWLCVPPLDVVDMTLQAQPGFSAGEHAVLPPVIVEGVATAGPISVDDLAEPELRQLHLEWRGRPGSIEDFVGPAVREYWGRVPPRTITLQYAHLKYIECGVMCGDGVPLEQMRNLVLSGKGPAELHAEFLRRFPLP